jgi:hypothetical protein
MNSFIIYKYVDPDEKNKYRDRAIIYDSVEPSRKNYVSSFKTISRDQRLYVEELVSLYR